MTTMRPASHPATNRKIFELVTAEHLDKKVLDIGAGPGYMSQMLDSMRQEGFIVFSDKHKSAILQARYKSNIVKKSPYLYEANKNALDRMDSSRTILCSCSAVTVGQKAA